MKLFNLNPERGQSSNSDRFTGYGHAIEAGPTGMFRPRITFAEDDGATGGASGGSSTPPEPAPEDTTGLKSALEKEREAAKIAKREAAQTKEQLAQLQESLKGIDPEKYKQLEKLQAEAEEWNKKEASLKLALETEYAKQIQIEKSRIEQLQQELIDLRKRTAAERAYQAAQGRSGGGEDGTTFFDMFYGSVKGTLQLSDKGELEVVDHNGARLFSKKDSGKLMSPTEYFGSMAAHPVLGNFFQAPNAKGGGMNANARTTTMPGDTSKLSRAERLTMARQRSNP